MSLVKIETDERLSWAFDADTTIYYRRATQGEIDNARRRHTHRGVTNSDEVGRELVRACVIGWEGYITAEGEPVPYSQAEVDALPIEVKNALAERILSADRGDAEKK